MKIRLYFSDGHVYEDTSDLHKERDVPVDAVERWRKARDEYDTAEGAMMDAIGGITELIDANGGEMRP